MEDQDLVVAAADLARELHADDVRKGSGESYFEGHLAPVAAIVAADGGTAEQVAAAYLHDAAEDHGGQAQLDAIRARFGDGRVKTYGLPDERVFGKLHVTIRCIREKLPVPCGIAASVSHTRCINSIQDFPVADFPGERLRTDGGGVDSLVWVEGLAEEFKRRFDFDSF